MGKAISFHGRETQAEALGRTWTFARWTLDILDDWTAWARTQLPSPIDSCATTIERMETEEAGWDRNNSATAGRLKIRNRIKDELVTAAIRQAGCYLDFTAPEVQSLLHHPRGAAQLVHLLLKKNQPDVTPELAFDIVLALPDDEMQRIMEVTSGKVPPAPNGSAPAA